MKFINLSVDSSKDEVLSLLKNYERVNEGVQFDERVGRPAIRVGERGAFITLTAKMIGGPTKDNGFIVGTFFLGKIKEREGRTYVKGIITTAPVYHLGLLGLSVFFVYKCIELGGFSPIPVFLLLFSLLIFKNEFKKQGIIARYLLRAKRRLESEK